MTEDVPPPVAVSGSDITIKGSKFGNSPDTAFNGTLVSREIGNSSQASTDPVKLEIGVDLSTGNWYSRASFSEGGVYGTPIPLVTDGVGMTNISSLSIITVQPTDSSETWGISSDGGDTVKIDSIRLLQGSSGTGVDFTSDANNPFVAAERGYIDDVIMPRNVRPRIAKALKLLRNKKLSNPWKKHDNLPL